MKLSRRFMLIAAAIAFGLPEPLARAAAAPSVTALLRLRGLARPPASARAVGVAYLTRFPDEREPLTLTRLVLDGLGLTEAETAILSERELRAQLAERLRAEFAEGRIATVGGWILSRTEARLCALWAARPVGAGASEAAS
jgi:hypothetical protein